MIPVKLVILSLLILLKPDNFASSITYTIPTKNFLRLFIHRYEEFPIPESHKNLITICEPGFSKLLSACNIIFVVFVARLVKLARS